MPDSHLLILLVVWIAAMGVLALGRTWRKTPGTGLVLAYVLNLWMIHWVAPALYLLPGYEFYDPNIVEAGLEQSMYGIIAFSFGCLLLTPFLLNFGVLPKARPQPHPDANLTKSYLFSGAAFYALLSIGVGALPSPTAIVATGQQLVVF